MSSSDPAVSIVIPVYNGGRYLRFAIESALRQTYGNLEVLVINDGSTDHGGTESIARSFGDAIRYFSKSNGGVSSALNYGISRMRGEYFAWLSHDDLYSPDKLLKQIDYLRSNQQVAVVATGVEVIDEEGEAKSSYSSGGIAVLKNGRDVMDHWVHGCSLLIRRDVFDKAGMFNEANRTVQDLEMWLKFVHEGIPIHMLPDILCQWRHHSESDSFRIRAKHFEEVGRFFDVVVDKYPLEFFGHGSGEATKSERQAIYVWLARQATRRGAVRNANNYYRKALYSCSHLFDIAFLRILKQYILTLPLVTRVRPPVT